MVAATLLSIIEESISGLRIIKAFNAETKMQGHQKSQNQQYRKIMNAVMGRRSLAVPLSEFLGTIIIVSVMMSCATLPLSRAAG